MNVLDKALLPFSPKWVASRLRHRSVVALYESAKPSRTRTNKADNNSGDVLAEASLAELRGQARHLDQNSDIAVSVLNTLVQNVIGPKGIGVEPQPRSLSGEISTDFAQEIQGHYEEWSKRPEVTREHSLAKSERLMARTWFRDGEVLQRHFDGNVPTLKHSTAVPYSIECLEPDFLPELHNVGNIIQGVEKDRWGKATAYHLFEQHPGGMRGWNTVTKRIPADQINRLQFVTRLHQTRGVSIFSAVMGRLNDIKDYEESERVAARIAAAMVAYVKRDAGDMYVPPVDESGFLTKPDRAFPVGPGQVWDQLEPGEDVGTIDSNRPSSLLSPFLETMHKMAAAGTWTSYSSISKNYNGTFSAQRQELVEQWAAYETLSWEFIDDIKAPTYERFLQMAIVSQVIKVPLDIDPVSLYDADYIPPVMPWIDPVKEAKAFETLLDAELESPQHIIRKRGRKPQTVIDQIKQWKKEMPAEQIDE